MRRWDASERRSNLPWRNLLSVRKKPIATGDTVGKTASVFDCNGLTTINIRL